MKIIFGATSFDRQREAQRAFRLVRKREEKDGLRGREVTADGINERLAHYQHQCPDCGLSYWDTSEYSEFNHVGCRGSLKKAGFSE